MSDVRHALEAFREEALRAPDSVDAAVATWNLARARIKQLESSGTRSDHLAVLVTDIRSHFRQAQQLFVKHGGAKSLQAAECACELAWFEYKSQKNYGAACDAFGFGLAPLEVHASDDSATQEIVAVMAAAYGDALVRCSRFTEAERSVFDRHLPAIINHLHRRGEDFCAAVAAAGYCAGLHGEVTHGLSLLQDAVDVAQRIGLDDVVKSANARLEELRGWEALRESDEWKAAGNKLYERGEHAAAVCLYTLALKADPANAKALANRALCKMKLGELEAALADALRAGELDRTYKRAFVMAATLRGLLRDFTGAIASINIAISLDPADATLPPMLQQFEEASRKQNTVSVAAAGGETDSTEATADGDVEPPKPPASATASAKPVGHDAAAVTSFEELKAVPRADLRRFFAWYEALPQAQRVSHLKRTCPLMVEQRGGTTGADGEDLSGLAHLNPGASVEELAHGDGKGLRKMVEDLTVVDAYDDLLDDAVHAVMDDVENTRRPTARSTWIRECVVQRRSLLFYDVRSGRTVAPPPSASASGTGSAAAQVSEFRTAMAARLIVPYGAYELAASRVQQRIQMAQSWIDTFLATDGADGAAATASD